MRDPRNFIIVSIDLSSIDLFHTPNGDSYVTVGVNGHRETWAVDSPQFTKILERHLFESTGSLPEAKEVKALLRRYRGEAEFLGREQKVFTRVGEHEGFIYVNLGNYKTVIIGPNGWEITTDPAAKFVRPQGMATLPDPVQGGSLDELDQFLNLQTDEDRSLLRAVLIAAFRPTGPYPITLITGEQGSAKSTLTRVIRLLVDPSEESILAPPRNVRDLHIAADKLWLLAYDNFSDINTQLSDALCRLSTGGGFRTRQLFSDRKEIIFNAQRPLVINSIEEVAHRSDLLDRAVALRLAPIKNRVSEAEFWSHFEEARGRILGAILDAVSFAMRNLPTVKLDNPPRMADFAAWAVAAEPALGVTPGMFLKAYENNRTETTLNALEDSPVAQAIQELIKKLGVWRGTVKDLRAALDVLKHDSNSLWPRSDRDLRAALDRIKPALRSVGIEIAYAGKHARTRRRLLEVKGPAETTLPAWVLPEYKRLSSINVETADKWLKIFKDSGRTAAKNWLNSLNNLGQTPEEVEALRNRSSHASHPPQP